MGIEYARIALPIRERWLSDGRWAFIEHMALQDTGNIVRDTSRLEEIERVAINREALIYATDYEKQYYQELTDFLDGN